MFTDLDYGEQSAFPKAVFALRVVTIVRICEDLSG